MKGGPDAMVYHYDAEQRWRWTTPTRESRRRSTRTATCDPRPYGISHVDFCFDPKGDGGPEDLVVTKTAQTSWEKVYTWDVEKSVDKSQLEHEAG